MKKHIVLAALGTDRPGVLRDLVKAVSDLGCGIADARMTVLGNELVLTLLATGTWNAVAKLESQVPAIGKRLELDLTARRTEPRTPRQDMLPYVVDVTALDQPGILFDLADFFASRDINVDELSSWTYVSTHTGAPMLSISMNVSIPSDLHVGRLRDDFTDFCDSLNLDATLEPARR
jgi:glycine cleavage system transcriptional repressor